MTPREFEVAVARCLEVEGYDTELGPYVGDWGVDILASRGAERIAVQAKMYGGTSRRVNRECVMQLFGAAAYFDCTGAVIATNGELMPDAATVAEKLRVRVMRIGEADIQSAPRAPRRTKERTGSDFDGIWEHHIMPLAGRTLVRGDGSSSTVLRVDWGGLTRLTSGGNQQTIPIEIFRWAIDRMVQQGHVTRDEINQHYPKRASSGIVLILAQVPTLSVDSGAAVVRWRGKR